MALTYDELDRAYRSALRRIAQLVGQREALELRLLAEKSRHLQAAQVIDEDLARVARERREQETGHELDRIAREARPAISLT